jgi:hypothetical protein
VKGDLACDDGCTKERFVTELIDDAPKVKEKY